MKIGVYICHCGSNIAATVDVEKVQNLAGLLSPVAVARDYHYMCSEPGQALIRKDIQELGLDRIVIAACSPRMHETTFRKTIQSAGLNPYFLEIANIREQCSWVHPQREGGTEKARDLLRAAVARVCLHEPLVATEAGVVRAVLVIGGGIAGLQTSLDVAAAGFEVCLVEKSAVLGGHVRELDRTFPHLDEASHLLESKIEAALTNPLIHVLTESEVTSVEGYVGNFTAKVRQQSSSVARPQEATFTFDIGTIVVATGYDLFDARLKPEYGYGRYGNVITGMELERLLSTGEKIQVSAKEPANIVFVHCVGSRDKTVGNEYCSRVCCMATAKQARILKERLPEAKVTVCYIDVRAFGKGNEEFYEQAQKEGILYRKGLPSEIVQRGGTLIVRAEDELLGEVYEEKADLVVLAAGITPRGDSDKIRSLLKLAQGPDKFYLEAHPKLRPLDTSTEGIFLAGNCRGPKDITDTLMEAHGAASRATTVLFAGHVRIDPATAWVDELICAGCGLCEKICEYRALKIDPYRQTMTVNRALCQACGACQATCPSGAISVRHATVDQVLAQLDEIC